MRHNRHVIIGLWLGIVMLPGLGRATGSSGAIRACHQATAEAVTCFAKLQRAGISKPLGYGPSDFRQAYGVPASGSAITVAIVGAFNDATIKADLDRFDATFGLANFPSCTSSVSKSCFERLDQRGGTAFGASDEGWAAETALDVETIHGLCQNCRLELVEADSSSMTNLMSAVDRATSMGAKVVSMSWGGGETANEGAQDSHFNHVGVTYVASSGDDGYGVSYPAASNKVLAVGGTRLTMSGGSRLRETTWTGSGSGCSRFETKPVWQHDSACASRTVVDVAADADPAKGAAIYSSTSPEGSGWMTVGGTSLAAPIIAGTIASSGSTTDVTARAYDHASDGSFHDVVSGSNGICGKLYLCSATAGYDGPTGLGAPVTIAAFH